MVVQDHLDGLRVLVEKLGNLDYLIAQLLEHEGVKRALIQFAADPLKLHRSDRGVSRIELACVGDPSAVLVQL
jgi:hypothetical protein